MGSGQSGQWYALATGTILRDYTIESVLGQGGFGIVYRARHNEVGHLVAIKEFLPVELVARVRDTVTPRSEDCEEHFEDGLRRFRDEARALIKLNGHPNIVACMDFFRANGTAYLVMEFVDGQPLAEVLRRREAEGCPFEEAELLAVAVPLVEGLAHVHRQGVLHRDIKPANILIRRADGLPVLIDFGAAKQLVAEQTRSFAPYTEGYAALEQVSGGELGPWTDLYGFGALMWRLVAGGNHTRKQSNPTKVESRMSARLRGDRDPLPPARELGIGRFSGSVIRVIDRCLELDPEERFRNCDEVLEILNDPSRHVQEFSALRMPIGERWETPIKEARQGQAVDPAHSDGPERLDGALTGAAPTRDQEDGSSALKHSRVVLKNLIRTFRFSRSAFAEIAADHRATWYAVAMLLITRFLLDISPWRQVPGGSPLGSWPSGWQEWVGTLPGLAGSMMGTLARTAGYALEFRLFTKWFSPRVPTYGGWFRILGFIHPVAALVSLIPAVGGVSSLTYRFAQEVIATIEITRIKAYIALVIPLIVEFAYLVVYKNVIPASWY